MENIHTKLYGPLNAPFFTYNQVPWTLHVRKELFSPSENSLSHPLALHLIFCQVVHDTYDEACLRIGREDRRRMQQLLDNYGIDPSNAADGHHKITLKRNVVETAKQWPLYFARLYPVSVQDFVFQLSFYFSDETVDLIFFFFLLLFLKFFRAVSRTLKCTLWLSHIRVCAWSSATKDISSNLLKPCVSCSLSGKLQVSTIEFHAMRHFLHAQRESPSKKKMLRH